VRSPFFGAPMLAYGMDEYDKELFQTPNGLLYVNPGIGWFVTPARFLCRPEITVIEF
jgi:predicted MPP superfamily phosphohydrolase